MASLPAPPLAEEEYLRLERQAETKSEFHDGQMFARAGGTLNHSFLASQTLVILAGLAPPGGRAFNSDLRIHIAAAKVHTYADGGVVCGEPQLSSNQRDNILNPVVIVEVLSPSTENYDRGKKFELYRTIQIGRAHV